MSQPPSLPPRCPIQNRGMPRRALDHKPQTTRNDSEFCVQHHRFPSHGSILDEQPSWLDDLLTDSPRRICLQRSSSDPIALLEEATNFHGPISPIKEEDSLSDGILQESLESEGASEIGCVFEAGKYVYGPNSPRQKSKLTESESSIVTALLENSPINPLQYLSVDCPSTSAMNEQNGKEDCTSGNLDSGNTSKRLRKSSVMRYLAPGTLGSRRPTSIRVRKSLFQKRGSGLTIDAPIRHSTSELEENALVEGLFTHPNVVATAPIASDIPTEATTPTTNDVVLPVDADEHATSDVDPLVDATLAVVEAVDSNPTPQPTDLGITCHSTTKKRGRKETRGHGLQKLHETT